MPSFLRNVRSSVSTWERTALLALGVLFLLSFLILLRRFYYAETILVPSTGGTYIEGSVGELQPLVPWFTVTNDVNRDIVSLVFSGLLKYNPETRLIEDDLATLEVSEDARIYTATLKEGLQWHDSTPESPHPVNADDVVFTFSVIQNSEFPNSLLRQNFQGVEVEKLSDRTVRFKLEEPYSFFESNLTLGLIPKRSFDGVPIGKLDQALDFAFHPVGAGPYAFKNLVETDLSTEVTLERFERSIPPSFRLERVVFRIFSDYNSLLADMRNLDGVRLVPHNETGEPIIPRRFVAGNYVLPQYVALFFNMDKPMLQDQKLRLGLQLGTNKEEVIKTIGEIMIVDTPLLEIDDADWRYKFDLQASQGALFSSDWNLPEKVRLQELLSIRESNDTGVLQMEPVVLLATGAVLTVTGSLQSVPADATINGLPITVGQTASGTWIAALPTYPGTGSLNLGFNLVRLTSKEGNIDTFYVWRTADPRWYKRAMQEQDLLNQFIRSRAGQIPEAERVGVADLFVEQGMLRRRLSSDPIDIRVNNQGERLSLTLLTSPTPAAYVQVAEEIKKQWSLLGVHVVIDVPENRQQFEQRLLARDYDVLLFGQSLLDNLDSYPYWHSSGMQKTDGGQHELRIDAYNLSQYSSLIADTLLELIRRTTDEEERSKALQELKEVIKSDVPAIFLHSPRYTFAYHQDLHGIELHDLSLHSDRFLTLHQWYLKESRTFKPGRSWFSFLFWLFGAL